MVCFNILVLLSIRLCAALGESFVTGVQMQTNIMALYRATACGLLKAKARGLWTNGTFQSCLDVTTLKVAQNRSVIVFRIVVVSEKLKGYSEDMHYFAKAALVNSRLNNDHNVCHTITGTEWMEPVPTLGTTIAHKAFYPGLAGSANCRKILSIAHHSINGQPLIGCNAVGPQTERENDRSAYFYLRIKTFPISPLLSMDLFRTLRSIAHIINYKVKACISVESVTTGNGWGRLTIAISDVGNHDRQNVCKWFIDNYTLAIRTGPFYNCTYQVYLAYRKAIILNLDIRETLDKIPLVSMNAAEIAWRTESLFNFNIADCISYDPEDLYVVFQKGETGFVRLSAEVELQLWRRKTVQCLSPFTGIQNEYYEMYLSGPLDEDICSKVREYYKEDYSEMFSTCERQGYINSPQASGNYSLHVLKSIKPVYLIDYPNYVDSHRGMIYSFNEHGCKYNGFVASL